MRKNTKEKFENLKIEYLVHSDKSFYPKYKQINIPVSPQRRSSY